MTKTLKIRTGAGLLALALAAGVTPAAAQDGLTGRAVTALGLAIAAQGDAALVQIREELKDALRDRVKPYLPKPEAVPAPVSDPGSPAAATEDRAR